MNYPFDRTHYRIRYPTQERPELQTAFGIHEVVDCSERGLRYAAPDGPFPAIGALVRGQIFFGKRGEVSVRGVVVRIQDAEVAVQLDDTEIPLSLIFAEQRYLRSRYPMWQ